MPFSRGRRGRFRPECAAVRRGMRATRSAVLVGFSTGWLTASMSERSSWLSHEERKRPSKQQEADMRLEECMHNAHDWFRQSAKSLLRVPVRLATSNRSTSRGGATLGP